MDYLYVTTFQTSSIRKDHKIVPIKYKKKDHVQKSHVINFQLKLGKQN